MTEAPRFLYAGPGCPGIGRTRYKRLQTAATLRKEAPSQAFTTEQAQDKKSMGSLQVAEDGKKPLACTSSCIHRACISQPAVLTNVNKGRLIGNNIITRNVALKHQLGSKLGAATALTTQVETFTLTFLP